jgi:methyl-accepting chemotaxis protein
MSGSYSKLNEFITHVKGVGLPSSSHYSLLLPDLDSSGTYRKISMLCESVNIPGIQLMTVENRTMGETAEIPFGVNYQPANFEIIVDNNFSAVEYFQKWTNNVYDRKNRIVGFYEDYAKQVTLKVQDKKGQNIYKVILHEAYPKALGDIQLAYASHEILKLNVSMNFKYWEVKYYSAKKIIPRENPSLKDSGVSPFSAAPTESLTPFISPFSQVENIGKTPYTDLRSIQKTLSGSPESILDATGKTFAAETSRAAQAAAAAAEASKISPPGEPNFGTKFGSLLKDLGKTSNSLGGAISGISRSLSAAAAPVTAVAGSISSISKTLGAIDGLMKSVGIKNSGLGGIVKDLNKTSSDMRNVAKLGGLPNKIGSVGANMSAVGTSMNVINNAIKNFPNSTKQMTNSVGKLGSVFSKQGSNLSQASDAWDSKTKDDNKPQAGTQP